MAILTVLRGFDGSDFSTPTFDLYEEAGNANRNLMEVVLISLGTDKRAPDDADLPVPGEPRGWWADTFAQEHGGASVDDGIGSWLWLLNRAKVTPANINRAQEYGQQSLAHMIADGLAAETRVTAERVIKNGKVADVALLIDIARDGATDVGLRFAEFWEGLA